MLIIAAMLFSLTCANAQEQKEELQAPLSQVDQDFQLAVSLSRYGYANKSVLSLVEAARIVKANGFVQGTRSIESGHNEHPATDEKAGRFSLDVPQLLTDARELAGKDKNLQAIIKAAEEDETTRGRVGGSSYDVDYVNANSSVTYNISFRAGQLAQVIVIGDGDTDLDVYVYDSNDNLITSDSDYTDDCICQWYPKWTGRFRIVIRNRGGVYNRYVLRTN